MNLKLIPLSINIFPVLALSTLVLHVCCSTAFANDTLTVQPLLLNGLENTYQYSGRVYGGSGPYAEADFAVLKQLGIELVVSVDGATPKFELAGGQGLRYVHIPIGYDAVPRGAQLQLVKAYRETTGSIYVHCHHGKHRGPAAIVSMLVGQGIITSEDGVTLLHQVGTSENYKGLYNDISNARVFSPAEIAEAQPLVSIATVSDFTQSMAAIDVHWDHLKLIRRTGWTATEEHPDVDPVHEALLLNEQFRELMRQDKEVDYSGEDAAILEDFRRYLDNSTKQSAELESGLRRGASIEYLEMKFQALKQSCVSCHEVYRN